jgi:uncharacterized protein with von Willebrand factor type A (vWA) domain
MAIFSPPAKPMCNPHSAIRNILDALATQVACYADLARLAEQQHEHVQFSRTEELLDVLQRRQAVLDGIAELEKIVGPVKRQWGDFLSVLDVASKARAENDLAETRRLLEEITNADRNDALVLQQRKLSIGKQLTQAGNARQVNRNIAASAYGTRGPKMDVKR